MRELLSGRRILVVEDEMLVLMMVEGILEDLGCRSVTSAATFKTAVSFIESEFFDAAVLDMNLDGHNSSSVADALLKSGVPFIYYTGGNDKPDMREGFCDHIVLEKPSRDADLTTSLAQLLS